MRIAAIDIGTNSVHMIVVQIRPNQSFELVDREKEMARLGSGGLGDRALTESSMMAALQVLSKFRRLAKSHDIDKIIAAATLSWSCGLPSGASPNNECFTASSDSRWTHLRHVRENQPAHDRLRRECDGPRAFR